MIFDEVAFGDLTFGDTIDLVLGTLFFVPGMN